MPLYQYRCEQGHVTELNRPVDHSSDPVPCTECGRPAQRLYRLRGIGFKGSGFHNTDHPGSRMRGSFRRADGSVTHWYGDGQPRNILS